MFAINSAMLAASLLGQQTSSGAGGAAAFGIVWLLFAVLAIACTVFWIWMLIDCLTSNLPTNEKILWVVVIALVNVLGALIYFFVARGKGHSAGASSTSV
jgi:ABC-type multidrug transport system fused ATPase/permease subunit